MLGTLLLILVTPILVLATICIIKEITGRRNLKFYTDQGVVAEYVPITGALKYVHPPVEPKKDAFDSYFKFFDRHQKNPHSMVATNTFYTPHPTIYLTDIDSIGEFIMKENDFYQRQPGMRTEIHDYFFLQNGQKALKGRASFAEFFKHENILKLVQDIQKIMLKRFVEVKEQWKQNPLEFQKFDVVPVLAKCFDDVINIVMFGEEDPSKIPYVNGTPLSVAIEHMVADVWRLFKSVPHMMTLGLTTKFRLTKLAREQKKLYNSVVAALKSLIQEREQSGRKKDSNLIDMMLDWNKRCDETGKQEEKYSLNSMVGLLVFFYSAGTDTSRATLTSLFYYLGEEQKARS